jgi:hypothetical protein
VGDPEGLYKIAQSYAVLGAKRDALHMLERSIRGGFFSYPYLRTDPLLNNLRGESGLAPLLEEASRRQNVFARSSSHAD